MASVTNILWLNPDSIPQGIVTNDTVTAPGNWTFTQNVDILGNLAVTGSITSGSTLNSVSQDAYFDLGFGYLLNTANQPGGFTLDTRLAAGFVPGEVTNFPTLTSFVYTDTGGCTLLVPGDVVMLTNLPAALQVNEGYYVVQSVSGAAFPQTVTIYNVSQAGTPWANTSFIAIGAVVPPGNAAKINLSVITVADGTSQFTDDDGNAWPVGTVLSAYVTNATLAAFQLPGTYNAIGDTSLQRAYDNGNTISTDGGVPIAFTVSDGDFTVDGTGLVDVNVGTSVALQAPTLNLGTTAAARSVNVGTGAASQIVLMGSLTSTSSSTIQGGTGGITITTDAVAGNITVTNTSTGVLNLFNDTGTGAVDIVGAGATSARTINIATGGTGAKTLNLGEDTVAGSNVNIAGGTTGGINIATAAVATPVNIATGATAGAVSVGTGVATQTLNFGTGSGVKTVTVGSSTSTSSTTINSGTGDITLSSTDAINGTATNALSLTSGTDMLFNNSGSVADIQAPTVRIGTESVGAYQNNSVTVGTTTSTLDFVSGGNTTFTSSGTWAVNSVGSVSINASSGVINVGNNSNNQNINIGTAGTRTITVGPTAGSSGSINITNPGSGQINIGNDVGTGTVNIAASSATSARIINIGTGGSSTKTVNIGTSVSGSFTSITSGTGGTSITSGGGGNTTLNATGSIFVDQNLYFRNRHGGTSIFANVALVTGEVLTIESTTNPPSGTEPRVKKANAAALEVSERRFFGVAVTPVSAGASSFAATIPGLCALVLFDGINNPSSAAQNGDPVFVSLTDGRATMLAPSGSGQTVMQIGQLVSASAFAANSYFVYLAPQYIGLIP